MFKDKRRKAALAAIIGAVLLATAMIPVVATAHNDSPGNNGTVKVHEGGLEPDPVIRDETHVCTFHLHFFFADSGQKGSWWIQSWPPTGDKTTVLSGNYETGQNGEYRTPASPDAYSLDNGHYKLFWQGRNDKNVKHKVFWVECEAPTPTPTPTPSPTPTVKPTPTPTATPSPSPSETAKPSPSEKPRHTPKITMPPTDTVYESTSGSSNGSGLLWALAFIVAVAGSAGALLLRPKRRPDR